MSGLLGSIALSHWTLISHNTFTSSFSTAPSGACSYNFSVFSNRFFLQRSQWSFFATLPCRLIYSFWANFSHPLTKCCTLSPFFHIICTGGFHWYYRCGALNSLPLWPVPVQQITMLLFRSFSHFCIIIAKFYSYQLSMAFPGELSIIFFTPVLLSSCAFYFLNSPLVTVSSVMIVSAAATPLIRFSSEVES